MATAPDCTLADAQRTIADLRQQLAARSAERDEVLAQQIATAEIFQVINSSSGDLAPVFDAMLEKALRLCDAPAGFFLRHQNGKFALAAGRGLTDGFSQYLAQMDQPSAAEAVTRVFEGEPYVHVLDLKDDEAYRRGAPLRRATVDLGHLRTGLAVPLRKDNELLGTFSLGRYEVRPFTDRQIALVQNFAAQAVIAIENARLLTETREALQQQTATAEVLQVINASPGDLAPVFEAMIDRAMHLCEAAFGGLFIYDGEVFRTVAHRNIPEALTGALKTPLPRVGALGRLAAGDDLVHIVDVSDTEEYRAGVWSRRILVDLGHGRTAMWVALRKEDTLLGSIVLYRTEIRAFTDKQIALLQNFAAQAVIAMENARLLEETRQRTEELQESLEYQTATSDVLKVISRSALDLQPVLDTVVDTANRLCGADGSGLTIRDGNLYRYVAATATLNDDLYAELRKRTFTPGRDTMVGRVALEGKVVHIADITADSDYALRGMAGEIRTLLGVPLVRDGIVIGTLNLTRKRVEPFTEKQMELVQTFADQAVIAIENARLITETREARDEAETALHDLQAAQSSLVQAQKMAALGQLTAGIAHEIKNPLNFVNNFASLSTELLGELREAIVEDKREEIDETIELLTGNLDKIAEHGARADNIVKSMLEHSRGVSGERREVDLNALIDEALNLAYHGARAQDTGFNVTLERDYAEGLRPIELAPQEMTRVFLNLFGNGFYATDQRIKAGGGNGYRPILSVSTLEADHLIEVKVRDNGTGIPPDIRDKLFQPFFTTKPTGEGTGLGLSISYDIVTQQHGGTIEVESEEGEFTEFTIRLPRN